MSRFLTGLFAALALLISGVPAAAQSIGYSPNTLPLSGSCGTVIVSTPCLNLTQTWNNVAAAFTGVKLAVTDTASASSSLLMDLRVGGVSKFSVAKSGTTTLLGDVLVANDGLSLKFGASNDVILARDAANTLALRNGTAAQVLNIYRTYTDASNYERLQIGADIGGLGANTLGVVVKAAGTGVATRPFYFGTLGTGQVGLITSGTTRWIYDTAGNYLANADNTYDIGASGTNRPRDLNLARNLILGASGQVYWSGRGSLTSPSDGVFTFANNAGTNTFSVTAGASNLATFNGGLVTSAAIIVPSNSSYQFATSTIIKAPSDGVLRLGNNASNITTDITLSGASSTGTSTATFGGEVNVGGALRVGGANNNGSFNVNVVGSDVTAVKTRLTIGPRTDDGGINGANLVSTGVAGVLQHGAPDTATPVAQTIKFQDVVAGTSNTAGVNATIQAPAGTGTGAGGSLIFQVAPAGSTGSAKNAWVTALGIDSSKTATFQGSVISGGNVQAISAGGFSWLGGKGGITQATDGVFTFANNAASNTVSLTVGASNLLTLNGGLKTTGATFALQTATTLTDNAAAQVATMTNGPAAGNPTKWIAINDNGTTRYIPAW